VLDAACRDRVAQMLILRLDHVVRIVASMAKVARPAELPTGHGLHARRPSAARRPLVAGG
jgi:hypothetical protein